MPSPRAQSVQPRLRLQGDAERISPSQRIALLSVVGEALNNVREHGAGVTDVRVEIAFAEDGVSAQVVDDGCGFDVEAALLSAARGGRMGLAGIHERVRLLGGRCVVDSRPGGPTSVSLTLPRWEPLAAGTPARRTPIGSARPAERRAPPASRLRGRRSRYARGGGALSRRPHEPVLVGVADRAAAVADAELAIDVREMELDRVLADPQLCADRLGRETGRDGGENRQLALCQRRHV